MKVTRASRLADQFRAEGWVQKGCYYHVLAKISGLIFNDPTLTDEEIGFLLAIHPDFPLFGA